MRVLSLDLSTHTGFSCFEGERGQEPKLLEYGVIHLGKGLDEFGAYPYNYVEAAKEQANNITSKCFGWWSPSLIVIEETNKGKNRYTQKMLEFLHYSLIEKLKRLDVPVVYINSSEWRKIVGLSLSKEQKKQNAHLRKAKREGKVLDKKALKIKGIVTKKHLSIDKVNELLGLNLKKKDNDISDSILLGLSYFKNAQICDGK